MSIVTHTPVVEDLQFIEADGKKIVYVLTASDRGDCCSTQAYYMVWLKNPKLDPLLFCRHHFLLHESSLILVARTIIDETAKLTPSRLVGSEN